jgi:hypothetical protein
MDSDREGPDDEIDDTKKRIVDEIQRCGGEAWVTEGRTIENYINPDLLAGSIDEIRPGFSQQVGRGQYEKAVPKTGKRSIKVKLARRVVEKMPIIEDRHGLRSQIDRLVTFIYKANNKRN